VSGTHSLHLHGDDVADNSQTHAYIERFLALPSVFFARAEVFVPSAPAFRQNQRTFMFVQEADQPFDGAQLGVMPGGGLYIVDWATPETFVNAKEAFPRDTWVCVVWRVGPGSMDVAIDGKPVAPIGAAAWTTPPYGRVRFGQWFVRGNSSEPVPTSDLWIDDIVVSSSELGCP
jgi:hypothetical protein